MLIFRRTIVSVHHLVSSFYLCDCSVHRLLVQSSRNPLLWCRSTKHKKINCRFHSFQPLHTSPVCTYFIKLINIRFMSSKKYDDTNVQLKYLMELPSRGLQTQDTCLPLRNDRSSTLCTLRYRCTPFDSRSPRGSPRRWFGDTFL